MTYETISYDEAFEQLKKYMPDNEARDFLSNYDFGNNNQIDSLLYSLLIKSQIAIIEKNAKIKQEEI